MGEKKGYLREKDNKGEWNMKEGKEERGGGMGEGEVRDGEGEGRKGKKVGEWGRWL